MEKSLDFFQKRKSSKKLLKASRNVLMLRSSQNVQNLDFLEEVFFAEKSLICSKIANFGNFFIECISNCNIAQEFSKRSKLVFYLGIKIVCSKKILASFQKQKSSLVSSRMFTKSYYRPRTLKIFRIWPFSVKQIDRLKKKRFDNLTKRLILQFFFQMRLESHYCSSVLKTFKTLGFLEKEMFFFEKKTIKICIKNIKNGYFSSVCLSKVIIAYANSKRSKLGFSSKKLMFFCEQILERFQERFLAFLSRMRVRLLNCFRFFETIKLLGFLQK